MADSGVYYRSEDGELLDRIVWRHYGRQNDRLVARVLDANPRLADHGPKLPAGVRILLPDFPAPVPVEAARLWT